MFISHHLQFDRVWIGVIAIGLLALSGCTTVAPWERGYLAKPQMALEPYPSQAGLRAHVYGSREAASGSTATEGGGCGCY